MDSSRINKIGTLNPTCIMYMQIQDIHMQTALRIQMITPALFIIHNQLSNSAEILLIALAL